MPPSYSQDIRQLREKLGEVCETQAAMAETLRAINRRLDEGARNFERFSNVLVELREGAAVGAEAQGQSREDRSRIWEYAKSISTRLKAVEALVHSGQGAWKAGGYAASAVRWVLQVGSLLAALGLWERFIR